MKIAHLILWALWTNELEDSDFLENSAIEQVIDSELAAKESCEGERPTAELSRLIESIEQNDCASFPSTFER